MYTKHFYMLDSIDTYGGYNEMHAKKNNKLDGVIFST